MQISAKISIWFFIGVLLAFYGALIFGYGIFELISGVLAPVVLAKLHAPVWWGALLTLFGGLFVFLFRPKKT